MDRQAKADHEAHVSQLNEEEAEIEMVRRQIHLKSALIKKKIKFSSYIRKFSTEQLQSHIWLMVSSYLVKYFAHFIIGSPSSYMTLQPIPSEFPYIWEKFCFLLYQCEVLYFFMIHFDKVSQNWKEKLTCTIDPWDFVKIFCWTNYFSRFLLK